MVTKIVDRPAVLEPIGFLSCEGFNGEFSHDFAECVRRLQIALEKRGWVGDEKVWVDRPILCGVRLKAAVDMLEATLSKTNVDASFLDEDEDVVMEKIFATLDQCLGRADHGLHVIERSDSDFLPNKGCLLDGAMRGMRDQADSMLVGYVRQLGEDGGRLMKCSSACFRQVEHWTVLAKMTTEAFDVFRSLYRLQRLQVADAITDIQTFHNNFTIDQVDQRIKDILDRLPIVQRSPLRLKSCDSPTEIQQSFFIDDGLGSGAFVDTTVPLFSFATHNHIERGESTLVEMPRPVIVPGGRFREGYYWDSYWIIRGLCAAGRFEETIDILINFFSCIDRFGFVPNGLRTYYLDRSQPPLLSQSVFAVYQAMVAAGRGEQAMGLLTQAFPRLLREYFGFWMDGRHGHIVGLRSDGTVVDSLPPNPIPLILGEGKSPIQGQGKVAHLLNRYYSACGLPRPESYTTDDLVLAGARTLAGHPARPPDQIFQSIRAAAESGWDFSSRWDRDAIENGYSPSYSSIGFFDRIDTINVLAVDLNAFMYKFEMNMAFFAAEMATQGNVSVSDDFLRLQDIFEALAQLRKKSMLELMWDGYESVWRDFDICNAKQSRVISAASVVPLWAGLSDDETIPVGIHTSLFKGWGIVPTPCVTGLQWDSPNVWPPLVHLAIAYLDSSRHDWSSWTCPPKCHTASDSSLDQNMPDGVSDTEPHRCENMAKKRLGVIESHVEIANQLATGFVHAAVTFYVNSIEASAEGAFSEKYNALYIGAGGSGGEYPNQTGFGWTNGALIDIVTRKWADLVI